MGYHVFLNSGSQLCALVFAMTLPPLHIPELFKQYHIRPKKSLGQNFLADHNALLKILRAAEIGPNDDVLEIGA